MFIDNQKKRVLMHCDTWFKIESRIIVVVTNENVSLQSIVNSRFPISNNKMV